MISEIVTPSLTQEHCLSYGSFLPIRLVSYLAYMIELIMTFSQSERLVSLHF